MASRFIGGATFLQPESRPPPRAALGRANGKDPMSKDLGTKHTCYKCDTKFYDLKRPAPICPKCGADQREAPPPTRASERRKSAVSQLEALEGQDEELLDEESEDDEETDEETDE